MPQKSTQEQSTNSEPWKVQQPYLQDAFTQAQGTYGATKDAGYTGDRVAQMTPDQLATFKQMLGYAGSSTAPGQTAAAGGALTGAGVGGMTGALSAYQGFKPTDGTAGNIANATSYADAASNPAAVDAVMRDARRQVSEQALPQVARSAAMSGNPLSSRTAISEGILDRGLAEKAADVSANMRSTAFGQGAALSESGRTADQNALLNAMGGQAAVGGAMTGTGIGALGSSIDQQSKLFDVANTAGMGQQAATQQGYDNSMAKSDYAQSNPWEQLQKYFGIVGGTGYGGQSTGTATTTTNPSLLNIFGGLLNAGGSLVKSDRRSKTDIKRVGVLDNGLPIYSYRYKDMADGPVFVGVMAQDVEKVRPEAVREFKGVKHVNYAWATQPLDIPVNELEQKWSV